MSCCVGICCRECIWLGVCRIRRTPSILKKLIGQWGFFKLKLQPIDSFYTLGGSQLEDKEKRQREETLCFGPLSRMPANFGAP